MALNVLIIFVNMMPIFFRTIGGGRATEQDLRELFNKIKEGVNNGKPTEKSKVD